MVQVPKNEASSGNILDFHSGKVAGLDINSKQVSIRGTSNFDGNSTPLFLIDGVPLLTGNNTIRTGPGSNAGKGEACLGKAQFVVEGQE